MSSPPSGAFVPALPPDAAPNPVVRLWGGLSLRFYRALFSALFSARARKLRRRPTHPLGVGAAGTAVVVAQPAFSHPFFRPGRRFAVRLRHANLAREDDACLDIRSASISLVAEDDRTARFDMPMNTGVVSAFWDTPSFVAFIRANLKGKPGLSELMAQSPRHHKGAACALVRAPGSYAALVYYAQLTWRWAGNDGLRAARYRLVGEGGAEPTLDTADRLAMWDHERRGGETRPPNYLRSEYLDRVASAPVRYRLELQLAPPAEGAMDSSVEWTAPWMDLAELTLDRPLSQDEAERLGFNIANSPDSLGYFLPVSPRDPNCLAWYRAAVYARTQRIRAR